MNKSVIYLLFLLGCFSLQSQAQVLGCTDALAMNYNPLATFNDGSCVYESKSIRPEFSVVLDNQLHETSGLVKWNHFLWTHNDDTDTNLYAIDTISGAILKTFHLNKVLNKDWEEIAQDSAYLYVGDFGNNYKGNRKDLHVLRIEKNSLLLNQPKIDTIAFNYSNQMEVEPKNSNSTDFDCEAFVVTKDSIYLFTKQWESKMTSVYSLPKTPGNYVANYKTTFDVKGLITGATFVEDKKLVVLCGYNMKLHPFVWLLYDFKTNDFFSGNKRKIKLRLPFHQIEGIATSDGLHYYLSNENFSRKPIVSSPQKLHLFHLGNFLKPYLAGQKAQK
ncbi:T9SS C-terminal target domain-containing protein [Flavobacterium psychrotolerans]|uniref:T9SS C-terminal target domain-containing protein n=1 Tax=Flavobacterium psychrotolerans TaxID=2169410 RepID=A0A2U1JR68_9FLAO|nr:T9SS C-terminal target domain-containing protein [Flavobacterium psychrotolerans]PWA07449.1 hypothetical protein DB895_01655 [Flavobacterium psychrotolerans]